GRRPGAPHRLVMGARRPGPAARSGHSEREVRHEPREMGRLDHSGRHGEWSFLCGGSLRPTVHRMRRAKGGWLGRKLGTLLSPLGMADFRRLWAADMVSLLGDWAGRLAL